ncbi:MAG: hypothetical protein ORN85_07055 [Sediminibacterium sp.]|nr:hypothetical protein [Sediminibacterium sp.]
MLKFKGIFAFIFLITVTTLIFFSSCNPNVGNFNILTPKGKITYINYYKDSFYISSNFIPSFLTRAIDSASYDSNFHTKIILSYSNDTLLKIDTFSPKIFVGQKINDSVFVASINADSVIIAIAIKSWLYDSNKNPTFQVVGLKQSDLFNTINPPVGFNYLDTANIPKLFLCFSKTNLNNTLLGRNIWTNIALNNDFGIIAVPRQNYNAFGQLRKNNYNLGFWIKKVSTTEAIKSFTSKEYIVIK